MNKAKLKTYAPAARRDFIQAVTHRAHLLGLTETGTATAEVVGDTVLIDGKAWPKKLAAPRDKLAARIRRDGFVETMEAMAYTWFNRFAALRYMELHGFLDHGYRVLSNRAGGLPEILDHAAELDLPGLSRQQVIDLKLAGDQDNALYRLLLIAQCNALAKAMPFLFERIDDETELLLPDNLLHTDSVVAKLVAEIPEGDWQAVEIIGWLYQFYISEKKDQVIGKVVRSEDIPAATQLFTPNWIVQYLVQNSVGRLWLMANPGSPLASQWQYYIQPAEQTPEVQAQLDALIRERLMEGGGGEGLGNGGGGDEHGTKLSGLDRVEKVDGLGGAGLSGDAAVSEGGNLRTHEPSATGGGIDSIEYRGGSCEKVDNRVSELHLDRPGFAGGSGNTGVDRTTLGLSGSRTDLAVGESPGGDRTDAPWPSEQSSLAPNPYPLTPPLDPETITVLDPACGSGHILVVAYDVLKAIYLERGYRLRDIPRLILEKNLYGLDIDDRAAQLAGFALLMKAREDDRRFLDEPPRLNVLAIQESKGLDADELATHLAPFGLLRASLKALLDTFEHAKTFGSLIQIPVELNAQLASMTAGLQQALQGGDLYARQAATDVMPLVRQALVLGMQFDAVVANPPYMGFSYYEPILKKFIESNYAEPKGDLYACFMFRGISLLKTGGSAGCITIPNWMSLSTFEEMRTRIYAQAIFETFSHNGRGIFGSDFGTCAFTFRKGGPQHFLGSFKKLFSRAGSVNPNEVLESRFLNSTPFIASASNF